MRYPIALPVILILAMACSGPQAPLVASNVVIKWPVPGMPMAAGYLVLTNNDTRPVTITRVSSPQFGAVEIHETVVEDGVSRMTAIESLTVGASSSVEFVPGGKHLMLLQPRGEAEAVTLDFHSGDVVVLTVNIAAGG